ncbi:MAG: cell division protein FtsZ [Lactobacillaceae bacterium]|jgi:cell division protein FtsZ|nr:cell division protein FtsZ [Lactobacillaceae bacterium]
MSIKLTVPEKAMPHLKPRISVVGVGGGGGNAVNNMINQNLEGVDFIVANTDAQALANSKSNTRIQLGLETTKGLGAGANPEIGKAAAEEALPDIERELEGVNMVFITAGMGGGTGSGAAPVVAKMAKEKGILTVGVVTKPFEFEGRRRSEIARQSIEEFTKVVDSIIIIPNQNLFRVADKNTTLADAFVMADNVLYAGIRSITDLMMMPGLINLDFADVKCIMKDQGKAIMGTGEAEGDNRALMAAEQALSNPLLDDCSVKGAKGVLINITGGQDITLFEIDEAANRIREEIDEDAQIIFGSSFDESLSGKIRVSIVATGIDKAEEEKAKPIIKKQSYIEQSMRQDIKVQIPNETLSANLEKFSANRPSEEYDDDETIGDVVQDSEEEAFKYETFEQIEKESAADEEIRSQIIAEDDENLYDMDDSNIIEDMPKASSLFKAITNKPEKFNVDSQLEIALAANQDSFTPKSTIKIADDEPELFPNHDFNSYVNKKGEEPEELIINDEDEYTPTLIERVTGFSIAKRNKKKKEEEHIQEPISPSFSREKDNDFSDSKLNLEIPSFLRRK